MSKITFWSFSRHVAVNILSYYQFQRQSFFLAKFIEAVKTIKPKKAFNKPVAIMVTALLILGSGLPIAAAGKNTPGGKVLR